MNGVRIIKHLTMTHWHVNRAFPSSVLAAIEQAIKVAERTHAGEMCFAVEGALHTGALLKGQFDIAPHRMSTTFLTSFVRCFHDPRTRPRDDREAGLREQSRGLGRCCVLRIVRAGSCRSKNCHALCNFRERIKAFDKF